MNDLCLTSTNKISKTGRNTPHGASKENLHHLDQTSKRSYVRTATLSTLFEKDLNTTILQKTRDTEISDLVGAIQRVEEHLEACTKEFKLKEAQKSKEKLVELKRELMIKRREELEEKYEKEIEKLMESQVRDMSDFNEFWDKRISEFEEEVSNVETEMIDRHKEEQSKVEEELRRVVPIKKKTSTQHLNYKKTLETLVKRKEFTEAEYVKSRCDQLEKEERTKAFQEKENRIRFFINQLDHRHKNETNVLQQRIGTGREKLLKAKVLELEKLLHKFQNIRQQLEAEQQLELSKFDITSKNFGLINQSEANTVRSTSRGHSRQGSRGSRMTLRINDNQKINMLKSTVTSPTNNVFESHGLQFVSPTATAGKHKRSNTSLGKNCFSTSESSAFTDLQSDSRTKRPDSINRQLSHQISKETFYEESVKEL